MAESVQRYLIGLVYFNETFFISEFDLYRISLIKIKRYDFIF